MQETDLFNSHGLDNHDLKEHVENGAVLKCRCGDVLAAGDTPYSPLTVWAIHAVQNLDPALLVMALAVEEEIHMQKVTLVCGCSGWAPAPLVRDVIEGIGRPYPCPEHKMYTCVHPDILGEVPTWIPAGCDLNKTELAQD